MVFIAYIRRKRVPEGEKFYVNFSGFLIQLKHMFKGESKTSKIISIILLIINYPCNFNNCIYI